METSETPRVKMLDGLDTFDDWIETLKENLASQGLESFIETNEKLTSDEAGYEAWEKNRALAKAIVKASIMNMHGPLVKEGWNPKSKDPKKHFDMAVRLIVLEAEAEGTIWTLTNQLCRTERLDFGSLAAYQNRLQSLRRRIRNLGSSPGDNFCLWAAINGLKKSNRRWNHRLEQDMQQHSLTWDGLMQEMWDKALKEYHPFMSDAAQPEEDD